MSKAILPGGLTKRLVGGKPVYQDARGETVAKKDAEAAIKKAEGDAGGK